MRLPPRKVIRDARVAADSSEFGTMGKDDGPQNVYDDPQFFAGYAGMDRFNAGWGAAMEHGNFLELVGEVGGRRILDLGCGAGQLAFHLARAGAEKVVAIDASERMLQVAREQRTHPCVSYRRIAMEDAEFRPATFDLVVSSLALHYVADYAGLVRRVADWLRLGGLLVYSTEHPIFTARAASDGWIADDEGAHTAWAVDDYAEEGVREHSWFVPGVRRYHRTLATLLNGLVDAGLTIERVEEPARSSEWLRDRPEDADERRRPTFLLIRARKMQGRS